jgi:hypothetical protein
LFADFLSRKDRGEQIRIGSRRGKSRKKEKGRKAKEAEAEKRDCRLEIAD